ncbi:MAG TPA: imidazolonepropionase [Fimbriimonadaceae bacterium]|nr:imidazolonepropionase [Fimbriimonadaceae bacterium]HRJ32923.1 imidazolonepropionase [Fimbriimonadaceae bacterium]
MSLTLVVGIRQLMSLRGEPVRRGPEAMNDLGLIPSAAMAIEMGRIRAVGPESEIRAAFPAADHELDCGDRLVSPGLIDAHTHLLFGGKRLDDFEARLQGRSYAEIGAAGGGIRSTMRATRALDLESMLAIGRRHWEACLRCGTTRLEAKSGYGLNLETELRLLEAANRLNLEPPTTGRIHSTFLGAHAVPPEFEGDRAGYLDHVIFEMLPQAALRASAVDMFVERGYFEPDDARRLAQAASGFGLGVRLHVDQLSEGGGAELAVELGCLSADHLEKTSSAGIAAVAQSQTWPILLPASVFGIGQDHYPNARAMIDAGLPVVLATDFNPGSSPTPSLPIVMSLACQRMKMTAAEAWVATTLHAAGALGVASESGSLEPGKGADFVVWDAEDYREIPYWFGRPLVRQVFLAGAPAFSMN